MLTIHAFALIVLAATMQQAFAQQPDISRLAAIEYIGRTGGSDRPFDQLKKELLRDFWRLDYDGGGIGPMERRFQRMKTIALHRSLRIMAYLSSDLDGDGIVQADERQRFVRNAARDRLLGRKEIDALPSEGEIQEAMRRYENNVREKFGDPDANGDGSFTYEEILAAVNATLPGPDDPRVRLEISAFFDRDGDGLVSETEAIDAVSSVLTEMDTDDDEKISWQEYSAFSAEMIESRRQLDALRKARAEAMGLGPDRPLPGVAWP